MSAGGWKLHDHVEAEVQAVFDDAVIKTALEAHIGAPVESVKVEAVKTQVVAGLNYRAKVTVNGTHKKTVAVYRPLPHTGLPLEVKAVEGEEAF